jgi:hypothetical protein
VQNLWKKSGISGLAPAQQNTSSLSQNLELLDCKSGTFGFARVREEPQTFSCLIARNELNLEVWLKVEIFAGS